MRRARQNDDLRDQYVSYGEAHLAEWTYKELSIFTFDLTVFLRIRSLIYHYGQQQRPFASFLLL